MSAPKLTKGRGLRLANPVGAAETGRVWLFWRRQELTMLANLRVPYAREALARLPER